MAFHNGSYTATVSPTISEGFGSNLLSTSISSLASIPSTRQSPSNISKAYRQASQLFLTRRLPEALSTVLPLITPSTDSTDVNGHTEPAPVAKSSRSTRIKVWSLYLTILNAILELDPDEGKEAFGTHEWRLLCNKVREGDVWEEVVQFGYHGAEGEVDSDVVINLATLLLAHARTQILNQKRLENYLAASSSPNLDIAQRLEASRSSRMSSRSRRSPSKGAAASGAATPRDLNARVKILELYTLHVLLRNNEWDYAREFISVSSVLDEERRDAFLQALSSLQEDQQAAEQKEREEQQRRDAQLQRDLEEARRLRAENEARERQRIEEERSKREGSEVDYGVDRAPPSPKAGRHRGPGPSSISRPARKSPPEAKKRAGPPTISARAALVMANLRRVMEQMNTALRANPMLLMRFLAFVIGLVFMFAKRNVRERIQRILGTGWNKVLATAGMGVKVSYI